MNLTEEENKDLLTVKEVAQKLRCSNSFVYSLYHMGKLKGIHLSRRYIRFEEQEVNKLLISKKEEE